MIIFYLNEFIMKYYFKRVKNDEEIILYYSKSNNWKITPKYHFLADDTYANMFSKSKGLCFKVLKIE